MRVARMSLADSLIPPIRRYCYHDLDPDMHDVVPSVNELVLERFR